MISNNKAQQGSAIYLETLYLKSDSYIQNTTFENNDSINKNAERGTVYLDFDDGIMDISNNTFVKNRGIESCISISNNAYNGLSSSYTKI